MDRDTIPAFTNLRREYQAYFQDDDISLSEEDKLLFFSHFTAIGNVWGVLERFLKRKLDEFKIKEGICEISNQDEYTVIYKEIYGKRRYILTDPSGEVFDTDFPHTDCDDDCCYPEAAERLSSLYGSIFDDVDFILSSFCNCLGYECEWEEYKFRLIGNGIITSGSAWSMDEDSLFENMEPIKNARFL